MTYRMEALKPGLIYRHSGTGSTVVVKAINAESGVIWESLTENDRIDELSWGKMQPVHFLNNFRQIKSHSEIVIDDHRDARLNQNTKSN